MKNPLAMLVCAKLSRSTSIWPPKTNVWRPRIMLMLGEKFHWVLRSTMKLPPEHAMLVVMSSMHGVGGVRIFSGTVLLKDAGQPIVVRSNPAFVGERSKPKRLTLKLKSPIVVGLKFRL